MDIKKIFNDVLNESPVYDDDAKSLGASNSTPQSKTTDSFTVKRIRNGTLLSKVVVDDYTIEIMQKGVYYFGLITLNNELIGVLEAYQYTGLPYPKVLSSFVYDDHQSKGLGKLVYTTMIDNVGGLISDNKLTGKEGYGSVDLWISLSKKYKHYLLKYKKLDSKDGVIIKYIKEPFSREMMGNSLQLFGVRKV